MSEWSKLTASTHGTFFGNNRSDSTLQQRDQCFDHKRSRATESSGEHVRAQQQHRSRFSFRERIAQTAGVTPHQVQLQLLQLALFDADIGQLAEPRVYAVDSAPFVDDLLDDAACSFNSLARSVGQRNLFSASSDVEYLLES